MAFAVEQNVIEFYVPVKDLLWVDVANSFYDLLEKHLS